MVLPVGHHSVASLSYLAEAISFSLPHDAATFQYFFLGRIPLHAHIRGLELAQMIALRRLGEQGSGPSHRTCYSPPQHGQVWFEKTIKSSFDANTETDPLYLYVRQYCALTIACHRCLLILVRLGTLALSPIFSKISANSNALDQVHTADNIIKAAQQAESGRSVNSHSGYIAVVYTAACRFIPCRFTSILTGRRGQDSSS